MEQENETTGRQGPPRFVKVTDAAPILGVSRVALYNWAVTGQVPAVKVGGIWLIPLSWLQEMEAQARQTA